MVEAIEQAEELIKLGRAQDALANLAQIIAANPNDLRAHSVSALAYTKLGDPDKAREHLRNFLPHLDRFPNPARARVGIAQRFANAGDLDQADTLMREAMALEPDNLETVVKRADFLAQANHGEMHSSTTNRHSRSCLTMPSSCHRLPSPRSMPAKSKWLLEYYQACTRIVQHDPKLVYHNMVAALLQLERGEEAYSYAKRWIDYIPDDIDAMAFYSLSTGRDRPRVKRPRSGSTMTDWCTAILWKYPTRLCRYVSRSIGALEDHSPGSSRT